jgi:cell division protein FtsB
MKAPKFPMLVKVLPYLNNRYFLTGLGFLIWISFFDRNDFITTWTYSKKLKTVQKEKLHYEEGIKLHKAQLQDLHSSKENLEKYAREQYNLKKENEDVFLIVEK